MSKQYKLVIFDLDGTLLNTLDDLADSVNFVLAERGYQQRTTEEVRSFVGNGIKKLIERAAPSQADKAVIEDMFIAFRQHYSQHCMDKTRPYDGITELLRQLRDSGIMTAIVSNKADSAVQQLGKHYFDGLLNFAIGERAGLSRKPEPDMINMVLCELDTAKEDVLYVGDSDVDIITARNAGLESVLVTWGFRDVEQLHAAGAQVLVDTADELQRIIFSY